MVQAPEAMPIDPVGRGPQPGARVGRYQVLRRLARGGMGEVMLARADGTDRLLALKCMHPQHAARPQLHRMFLREARIAERLWHPSLVRVFDSGEVDGRRYLVMEFVHGETVQALLRRASALHLRVPLGHALSIGFSVCAALHHAHEARMADGSSLQLVHRDVSPQNVMVSYEGEVKLLDFGIARSALQETATDVGQLKGKAGYMSPEQCLGLRVDRRADVYAAGILLYELTLGRKLFRGKSDYDLMRAVVAGEVIAPRAIDPGYDEKLERVVLRALERDPGMRFQTAREMAVAIEDVLQARALAPTAEGLRRFVRELFADRVTAWERAQAAGQTLAEHLTEGAAAAEAAARRAAAAREEEADADTPVRRAPSSMVGAVALGPSSRAPSRLNVVETAFSDEVRARARLSSTSERGAISSVSRDSSSLRALGPPTLRQRPRTSTLTRLRGAVARIPTGESIRAIAKSAASRRREIFVAAMVALPFFVAAALLLVFTLRRSPLLPRTFRPEPRGESPFVADPASPARQ